MISPRARIQTTTDGRLKVSWPGAGRYFFAFLCARLRFVHGLRRSRRGAVPALNGSLLMPDFVGDRFRLHAGWNPEDGYYLRARNEAGDQFLEQVFARGARRY